jgi:glycerophosphoryl diester phosphodiesterase
MRSIREALRLQVDAIEIDVRATKDGVLILMHDETVDRTTDGRGAVGELTWSEILRLDAGSWMSPDFAGERVPRLDEVLTEVAGRVVLHIEVKAPETVRRIVHTVKLHNAE